MNYKKIEKEFIEKGANLEHQRWARWQTWCHKVLRENCPSPELERVLERWDRQIKTPYSELSEQEKESDRKETRNYLPFLKAKINEVIDEMVGEEKCHHKFNTFEGTCNKGCGTNRTVATYDIGYNQKRQELIDYKKKFND